MRMCQECLYQNMPEYEYPCVRCKNRAREDLFKPKEQSVFQRWDKNTTSGWMHPAADITCKYSMLRKEGWNAAIEAVLDIRDLVEYLPKNDYEKIKKLKEP